MLTEIHRSGQVLIFEVTRMKYHSQYSDDVLHLQSFQFQMIFP